MEVTIHQLEFMSYLGFWDKISNVDKLVLLDDVDFRKNYFQNRNKILINGEPNWFGVEVEKSTKTPIKDVIVSSIYNPTKKVKTIEQAYKKAPYFDKYAPGIIDVLKHRKKYLIEYNMSLFLNIRDYLGIDIKDIAVQSQENYEGDKSDLIINICKSEGATSYYSGVSGIDYLDLKQFESAGIDVKFQEYIHPVYNQLNSSKFVPYLSIIDLLFNEGENALKILKNGE